MTVGVMLVTHGAIGANLLDSSTAILGISPLATAVIPVAMDSDPDEIFNLITTSINSIDSGDGVLILTDIIGATPNNIACRLSGNYNTESVSGVNMPMLLAVLANPSASITELSKIAVEGAKRGIRSCSQNAPTKCDVDTLHYYERKITICNKLGLHARASAKLAKLANSFQSNIYIKTNNKSANAKNIMELMMLAASIGTEVTISVDKNNTPKSGNTNDQMQALSAVVELINTRFGESE